MARVDAIAFCERQRPRWRLGRAESPTMGAVMAAPVRRPPGISEPPPAADDLLHRNNLRLWAKSRLMLRSKIAPSFDHLVGASPSGQRNPSKSSLRSEPVPAQQDRFTCSGSIDPELHHLFAHELLNLALEINESRACAVAGVGQIHFEDLLHGAGPGCHHHDAVGEEQ